MLARMVLLALFVCSPIVLLAQGQFYLAPGTLARFGLDSLEITALAAEPPRGANYPQGMIAGFPLFAGTKGHGVYVVEPFAASSPAWQTLGLSGKTITALTVQHQGAGPLDWLSVHASAMRSTDTTLTREYTANAIFTGSGPLPTETGWRLIANDSVKQTLRVVRAMASGSYSGHEPPVPVVMGGSRGVFRMGANGSADSTLSLDSIDVTAMVCNWREAAATLLVGGTLRGVPVIYRSHDEGLTWLAASFPSGAGDSIYALSLLLSGGGDTAYAAAHSGFWRSVDGGATWQLLTGDASMQTLEMDQVHSPLIFTAWQGKRGFYQSRDGITWWRIGTESGMGEVTTMALLYPASSDSLPYLFLGTRGTGVWAYRLTDGRLHLEKPFTYPLARGNIWSYLDNFGHELRKTSVGDTLMADGRKYAIVRFEEGSTSGYEFLRQEGDVVYTYTSEPFMLYDFGQELGQYWLHHFGAWKVTTITLSQDTILGRDLRTWTHDVIDRELFQNTVLVDSLGMTYYHRTPSLVHWKLRGAVIDGVEYGTLTAVHEAPVTIDLPKEFRLEQNYPNPFNPTTWLRYSLPVRGHVTLEVFDALGHRVAMLVNDDIAAGVHDVSFDAVHLASGTYFCRLRAGGHVATRVMLLLR